MHFGAVKRTILNDRLMNSLSLPTSPGGERDVDPRESGFANGDRSFSFNSQIFGVLTHQNPFCWVWNQQSRVDISHRLRFNVGME